MICSLELLVQQGEWFQVQQLLHCGSCGAGCGPLASAEHCSFWNSVCQLEAGCALSIAFSVRKMQHSSFMLVS